MKFFHLVGNKQITRPGKEGHNMFQQKKKKFFKLYGTTLLPTQQTNSMKQNLSWEVKKFPAFYWTERFITCPYPGPDQSPIQQPKRNPTLKSISNII